MNNILRGIMNCVILVIVGLSFINTANAQLDPTFGTNGTVTTNFNGEDRLIESFVLPDSRILTVVAGTLNGQTRYYLARYNSNGTLDAGYGANGIKQLSFAALPNAVYTRAARQPNGKIILSGSEGAAGLVVSLNEDGTLNTAFAGGGIQRPNFNPNGDDTIDALGVQPDGKIVVSVAANFARYLPDGTLDPAFGDDGTVNNTNLSAANEILFQSNGKIITKGADAKIRRFNANGRIDSSFTTIESPYNNGGIDSILIQPDDKILLGGIVYKTEALERFNINTKIVRYTGDGSLDTSFGSNGAADFDITSYFWDTLVGLAIDSNGQIFVSGNTLIPANRSQAFGYRLSLARLTTNGQLTGRFLVTDSYSYISLGNLKILPDGKILTINTKSLQSFNNTDLLLTRSTGVPLRTYYFKGTPYDFVYNGYQPTADLAVYRPSNLQWYYNPNVGVGDTFGATTDIRVPSDYIRDFGTDVAVFRPGNGTWYITTGYGINAAQNFIAVRWGQNGDVPVPEDYDGDGKSDIAVFRPSNGTWYIRNSADNSLTAYQFGTADDKPVAGDYDGDHKADIAVYRPSSGTWYVLKSSNGFAATQFGTSEDIPVQEDYDGDGVTDIAVWRPSSGYWYRLNSSDGNFAAFAWGTSGDKPVPADYDGDLKTDVAVWRPSNAKWYIFRSSDSTFSAANWGTVSDFPVQERK